MVALLAWGDHEKKRSHHNQKIDMRESWIVSDRKTILFGRDCECSLFLILLSFQADGSIIPLQPLLVIAGGF